MINFQEAFVSCSHIQKRIIRNGIKYQFFFLENCERIPPPLIQKPLKKKGEQYLEYCLSILREWLPKETFLDNGEKTIEFFF